MDNSDAFLKAYNEASEAQKQQVCALVNGKPFAKDVAQVQSCWAALSDSEKSALEQAIKDMCEIKTVEEPEN